MRCNPLACVWVALFSATGTTAALPGSQALGVDYSEPLPSTVSQIAADSSGALYVLANCEGVTTSSADCVIKLSADGKTVLWQDSLGFGVQIMTVDPAGGVYVVPASHQGDIFISVARLAPGGTGIAWRAEVSTVQPGWVSMAADSAGRLCVAGPNAAGGSSVVVLNAAGTALDYATALTGIAQSIAVDGAGSAYVAGLQQPSGSTGFLARINASGSVVFNVGLPGQSVVVAAVQATPGGNTAVLGAYGNQSTLWRFDSSGALSSSIAVPYGAFALDSAGNAYIAGSSTRLSPARNSLATCAYPASAGEPGGGNWLAVFAPDGSIVQWTYLPVAVNLASVIVGGPSPYVFLNGSAAYGFAPTQSSPIPGSGALVRLSPASAQTYPLACLGNSADYNITAISPGDIITLFGNGLGPQQGVQTAATLQTPYPKEAAGVRVTFDGSPAPLLWVQDSQINVVAPWSLTPGNSTEVCVSYNSVKTNCLTWPVTQADPGVYMLDATHAVALNQDGSLNSADNPASPGSTVTVFATGLGPLATPQPDGVLAGSPAPGLALPIQPGEWEYFEGGDTYAVFSPVQLIAAGQAPGMVAGASAISFQSAGNPYTLSVAGALSPLFCIHQASPAGDTCNMVF